MCIYIYIYINSVQLLSHVQPCDPMDCSMPGFPVLHYLRSLLKLMSIELVMPFNHLILCRPLLLLPSVFASIRVFCNELALHVGWPKYCSFCSNILRILLYYIAVLYQQYSREYSGLISFRIDWLDLLAVQGALKSLIQHHSLKASVLWCSAFFMVYSHICM